MKKFSLVLLAVVMMLALGCGKKQEPAAADAKAEPTAAPVAITPSFEGWAMAQAFMQDEIKAGEDYVGKTLIVRNLVIYAIYEEEKRFEGFAYDSATNTISTTGMLSLNGAEAKATETDFYFSLTLADAADLAGLKAFSVVETPGGKVSDFAGPYAFEAKVEKIEGNNIYFVGAKPIAK